MRESGQTRALGRIVRRNIFGENGVLLVPACAVMTQEYAVLLQKHGIVLGDDDLFEGVSETPNGHISHQRIIDEAVTQVKELFSEVRSTRKLPLAEFRKEVVPVLSAVAEGSNLLGLLASVQSKDDYTYRHNVAVGAIAGLLGRWMNLEQQELLQLITAALLHDVGKMLLPMELLQKPGPLSREEFELVKKHTVLGYELLEGTVGVNHRQAMAALQHHERLDGSGYPLGVAGNRIDLFSRVVSVADVFHAMVSARSYREPLAFHEVLGELHKDSFGRLDPVVTRLFIVKITERLQGSRVTFTDGSEGTIVLTPAHDPLHPLVQIGDAFVDLGKDPSLRIRNIW